MKQIVKLSFIAFIAVLYSCGNSKPKEIAQKAPTKEELIASINEMEVELKADVTNFNKEKADTLVNIYIAFADSFSKDSLAVGYLFKAGDVARGLGRFLHAIDIYERIINDYPQSEKASIALFIQAFIFDNDIDDDPKAGDLYKMFIDKYPDHQLRESAEISIQNLGKSDEDLIRDFEKKSKNKV